MNKYLYKKLFVFDYQGTYFIHVYKNIQTKYVVFLIYTVENHNSTFFFFSSTGLLTLLVFTMFAFFLCGSL